MVRKLDPDGRITLPSEMRRKLGVEIGMDLEIYVDGNTIVLMKPAEKEEEFKFLFQSDKQILEAMKNMFK